MIDLVANAVEGVPLPTVDTVVPAIINPKILWLANKEQADEKSAKLGKHLDDEFNAAPDILVATPNDPDDVIVLDDGGVTTDEEHSGWDTPRQQAPPPPPLQATKAGKMSAKARNALNFFIVAVTHIKAAASNMARQVEVKGRIARTNKNLRDLSYNDIYHRLVVTPADVTYYQSRRTTSQILDLVDADIATENLTPFEWLPRIALSDEAMQRKNARMVSAANSCEAVRIICQRNLQREKEMAEGETITRVALAPKKKTLTAEELQLKQARDKVKRAEKRASAAAAAAARVANIGVADGALVLPVPPKKSRTKKNALLPSTAASSAELIGPQQQVPVLLPPSANPAGTPFPSSLLQPHQSLSSISSVPAPSLLISAAPLPIATTQIPPLPRLSNLPRPVTTKKKKVSLHSCSHPFY